MKKETDDRSVGFVVSCFAADLFISLPDIRPSIGNISQPADIVSICSQEKENQNRREDIFFFFLSGWGVLEGRGYLSGSSHIEILVLIYKMGSEFVLKNIYIYI